MKFPPKNWSNSDYNILNINIANYFISKNGILLANGSSKLHTFYFFHILILIFKNISVGLKQIFRWVQILNNRKPKSSVRPKQFRYRFSAEISVSAVISAWPKWKNHFGIGFGSGRNKRLFRFWLSSYYAAQKWALGQI